MLKERESNIELLRIICMMIIIGAHFVYHGGALSGTSGVNQVISSFLAIGGKVGFDCFIVISAWFLVNSSFKIERFLKVWGQVLFYNVLFIFPVMMKILPGGTNIGIREAFAAFFPIMGSSHGYACVYLLWYLLLPVMQIFQKHCTDKQLLYMLGIMTVGLIGTHTVSVVTGFSQNVSLMSNDLLLFVYIYYLMVWFRRKNTDWNKLRIPALMIFIITWSIMGTSLVLRQIIPGNQIIGILSGFVFNERSILNIMAGLALFVLAMGWKIPYNKVINFLAASTFGVLLYHDHNYFRNAVWQVIIRPERFFDASLPIYVMVILVCIVAIFMIGVIVDVFRRNCVEKLIMRSLPEHKLSDVRSWFKCVFECK